MRAWATCGCSHAFSVELKNKKRVELPKMRHLFLMGEEEGRADENERKSCRGIRNFNSPGSSLVSNPMTQSLEQVSYFWQICRFNLSSDIHENDNDVTKINTRK